MADEYDEYDAEEEVWDAWKDIKDGSPKSRRSKDSSHASSSSSSNSSRCPTSGSRMIPRSNAINPDTTSGRALRQSAPVSIPNWSRPHRHRNKGSSSHLRVNDNSADHAYAHSCENDSDHGEDDSGEDEDRIVPPHEWLAKKMARSQISSSSVCEGAGRTLKGRDLRKVRNAVLTKTGFLE